MILHDWGSALGFHWACSHPGASSWPCLYGEHRRALFRPGMTGLKRRAAYFRASGPPRGEDMILSRNMFIERVLPISILRKLTDQEMAEYRAPFRRKRQSPENAELATTKFHRRRAGKRRRARAAVRKLVAAKLRPKAVYQRGTRLDTRRRSARVLPGMAQSRRGGGEGTPLHPGRLPRRNRTFCRDWVAGLP